MGDSEDVLVDWKSCLVKELTFKSVRGSITCPTCNIGLGHIQNLYSKIVHDRNLQSMVDKLFPEFEEQEREFIRKLTMRNSRKREREDKIAYTENTIAVSSTPANSYAAPQAAGDEEHTFSMEPDVTCSEDKILPPLVRPQFQGPLTLKVAKVLSFVAKRIAPLLSDPILKEDIEVLFDGLLLDPQKTLSQCIGSYVAKERPPTIVLHYRRRAT
eukprot:gene29395-35484_t